MDTILLYLSTFAKYMVWPIVAVIAIFKFRKPLADLFETLAKRATKLSVGKVKIELAAASELKPLSSVKPSELVAERLADSARSVLSDALHSNADYGIVDLKDGNEWLTSRLFLFSAVLGVHTH